MKIKQNPDKEFVKSVREQLKENKGYFNCVLEKTPDSKCMCKEFRDKVDRGETGVCHCGLYIVE